MQWTYEINGLPPQTLPPTRRAKVVSTSSYIRSATVRQRNFLRENLKLTTTGVSSPVKGAPLVLRTKQRKLWSVIFWLGSTLWSNKFCRLKEDIVVLIIIFFYKADMICIDSIFYMEDSECLSSSNILIFLWGILDAYLTVCEYHTDVSKS